MHKENSFFSNIGMSTAASSSIYRRLHGIFAGNRKINVKLKPDSPKTTSSTISKPTSSKRQELQTIVNNFKKSSESPKFRRHNTNYEKAIRRLDNSVADIEDILEHQKKYPEISNEFFVSRLMLLYGRAKMYQHARKLFDEMPILKCERTVYSFNALLEACFRAEKYDQMSKLFRELPEALCIEPDVVSYNTLIKNYCKAGSFDSAVNVMDEMENKGIKPDKATFNTLMNAHYESKMFSEAEDLWLLMQKKNVAADLLSCNIRLRGLVANNQVIEAIDLFEEMGKKEIKPDAFSYTVMIKTFVDDKNFEEAKKWYKKMVGNGRYPNMFTFGMLIDLACDQGNLDFALELCKKAMDSKVSVYNPTMQRVVDNLVENSKLEEAKELVNLAKSYKRFHYKLSLPSLQ